MSTQFIVDVTKFTGRFGVWLITDKGDIIETSMVERPNTIENMLGISFESKLNRRVDKFEKMAKKLNKDNIFDETDRVYNAVMEK